MEGYQKYELLAVDWVADYMKSIIESRKKQMHQLNSF